MIVVVGESAGTPYARLDEAAVLTALSVRSTVPRDRLGDVVRRAGAGELDGDHVWLDTGFLERNGPDSDEWRDGLAGMLAFAASRGWTSGDGARVRAHVEAPAP